MGLINDADAVLMGDVPVGKVYSGHIQVWPPPVVDTANVTLVVNDPANGPWVRAFGSFNGQTPDQWRFYLSEDGGSWQLKSSGSATVVDIATSWETECWVKVETLLGGQLLATGYSNKVTVGSEPVPETEQKTVTLYATRSATYNGSNVNRNVPEMYGGMFSGSAQGEQKSMCYFAVPDDVRYCISVDKVEFSFYTDHHWYPTGGLVRFAPHRQNYPGGFPATFPGAEYPTFGEYSADRDRWVGGGSSRNWLDITNNVPSGWGHTMATEFRTQGCWGFVINAPNTTSRYYGWWHGATMTNKPGLRITYTVYT